MYNVINFKMDVNPLPLVFLALVILMNIDFGTN